MRRTLFSALVVGAQLAAPLSAWAQTMGPGQAPPQIMTTGEGEAHVVPDRATIYIGVQSRAATAAAAAADNARKQRAVIDTIKALGLAADQLSTMNYQVTPEMQYDRPGGVPRVTGYIVTNTVRVEVRRIEDVGRVVDVSLAKGANQMNGLQFWSAKSEEARRSALAEAVAKARADAETIARAAGGTLGNVIEIVTSGGYMPRQLEGRVMSAMAPGEVAPTPIEPGQQTVRASVTARWMFVQGGR